MNFSGLIIANWGDSPRSVLPIYKELIAAGLRIWVFRYIEFLFRSWFALNSKSLEVATLLMFNIRNL